MSPVCIRGYYSLGLSQDACREFRIGGGEANLVDAVEEELGIPVAEKKLGKDLFSEDRDGDAKRKGTRNKEGKGKG